MALVVYWFGDFMVSVGFEKLLEKIEKTIVRTKFLWNRSGRRGFIVIIKELHRRGIHGGEQEWQWRRRLMPGKLVFEREINPHIAIVGESGSGKSNACMALISRLAEQGAHFAVLDSADEYIGLAKRLNAAVYNCAHSGINIFELDGLSPREKTSELVNMLTRHFRLGQYQASVLNKCIKYMYSASDKLGTPSTAALAKVIAIFRRNADAKEAAALKTLQDRLDMIYSSAVRDSIDIGSVLSGNSIFAMSELHTDESQSIFMEGFLRKIYSAMLEKRKNNKGIFFVVIEEAAKLGESTVVSRLVSEGRKYGVGMIAVAQSVKGLSRDVRVNSAVFVSFYQREPEELNYVSNFISGGNEGHRFIEVKKALRSLRRHSAVMLLHSRKEPVIVKFPAIERDSDSLEYRISELCRSAIRRGELLRKLYSRGMYYNEAQSRIAEMLESGAISAYAAEGCGSYDGTWYIAKPHNSARHDIMVAIISRRLAEKGVRCRIYNGPNGPDVVAHIDASMVAYEYETGSKSRTDLIAMLERRRKEYATVVVITDNMNTYMHIAVDGVRLLSEQEFFS